MFPWSYLSHVRACRLMLAEDTGGGDGGGDAGDTTTDVVHDARPPELLPCPFCGGSELDTSGEVVTCSTDGVVGPSANADADKYGAWNNRATAAPEDGAAPDPASDPDPAATAASAKTLADARKTIAAVGTEKNMALGRLKMARAAAAAFRAQYDSARKVAADKDKALTAANGEVATLKADKAGETKRTQVAIRSALTSNSHPPVANTPQTKANGTDATEMKRSDFDKLPLARQSAFVRSGGKLTD